MVPRLSLGPNKRGQSGKEFFAQAERNVEADRRGGFVDGWGVGGRGQAFGAPRRSGRGCYQQQ